jgi:toxin YoeB
MELVWQSHAWEDYLYWQETDKKILQKINELIKDYSRNSFKGLGKPEPLKGKYSGFWSRRITDEHRLVYYIKDKQLHILQCRFHYDK